MGHGPRRKTYKNEKKEEEVEEEEEKEEKGRKEERKEKERKKESPKERPALHKGKGASRERPHSAELPTFKVRLRRFMLLKSG